MIAATFGFGTTITFPSEEAAFKQYPQIVLAFKSKLNQFRNLGIAPIAAAGQFGAPLLANATSTANTGGIGGTAGISGDERANGTTTSTDGGFNNNVQNANIGDNNGMPLPAVLNNVISVTGSYPFPFAEGPGTPPTDPGPGVIPQPLGPILIYSEATVGGTPGTTGNSNSTTACAQAAPPPPRHRRRERIGLLTAGDFAIYSDRIMASANRNWTTDFAAPAIDVPTFRQRIAPPTTTTATANTTTTQDTRDHNVFDEAGAALLGRRGHGGLLTGRLGPELLEPVERPDGRSHVRRLPDHAGRGQFHLLNFPGRTWPSRTFPGSTTPTGSTRSSPGPPSRPPTRTTASAPRHPRRCSAGPPGSSPGSTSATRSPRSRATSRSTTCSSTTISSTSTRTTTA